MHLQESSYVQQLWWETVQCTRYAITLSVMLATHDALTHTYRRRLVYATAHKVMNEQR